MPVRPETAPAANDVLWEIVDEHLAQATVGLELFERSLDHPLRTLQELERFPERGLIAHIDALAIGGPAVRDRLLMPLLKGEDDAEPVSMLAAALALLEAGRYEPIWAALAHAAERVRRAGLRAAALSGRHDFDRGVLPRLELQQPPAARAALLELVAVRALPPPNLFEALQNDDPHVVAAAARAAVGGEPKVLLPIVESVLEHPSPAVREAGLLTALAWSSHKAWLLVQKLAHDRNELQPLALQLTAALGGRAHHQQIVELLRQPELKQACLFALGWSGNAEVLPVLIEHIAGQDAPAAKLAAQAFSIISGLDLRDDVLAAPERESEPDAGADSPPPAATDLAPIPEQALPSPNAEAYAAWLRANARSLDASRRLLHGAALTLPSLLAALESAPLRRRHGLSLMLSLRTGAALRVDTRLFAAAQRSRLASARALAANLSLRSFANW